MKAVPKTGLDQWAVLRAVIDEGSFARAAKKLNRSQSSVSYTITKLQELIGIPLLEMDGRRAILTEAGRKALADAMPLIDDLIKLEQRCAWMGQGREAQVRLMVDAIFPKPLLFSALSQFHRDHPDTEIVLREIVRRPAGQDESQPYDLAITLWDKSMGFAHRLTEIEMVAVARPDHPLHQRTGELTFSTLARYPGLIIEGQDPSMSTPHILNDGPHWRVNTLEAALAAVRQGLCHGWLPAHLVAEDIAAGLLRPLPLSVGACHKIPLILAFADEDMAGPLTHAMADLIRKACGTSPEESTP